MKAKITSNGEITDVLQWHSDHDVIYSTPDKTKFYHPSEVEIIPDNPHEATIGWIARDKDGCLIFFYDGDEPRRDPEAESWHIPFGRTFDCLPNDFFPLLTYDSDPLKAILTLTPVKPLI